MVLGTQNYRTLCLPMTFIFGRVEPYRGIAQIHT